ncbi:hypothetical protein LXH13_12345 [Streptomyces spinosirectus]|uniref:hypothetical protein n=1 Tax=Streptomyces TaxID=1883 RepID=UPI001C9DC547|nr:MULTISPECIES: hypothetical protein [Streptomyces]MBY8342462.1 hypothetical protein [Streptomyces plumbidurans]UIR17780.1 hypothetical protein LXH13_12345 [Streptomyces spinosirectus]
MPAPLFTSPEPSGSYIPSGPSGRTPRLGPHGLLSRRRVAPGTDGSRQAGPAQQARPGGRAPEPAGTPLPSALLPLPPGFALNRDQVAFVVPA